MSGQTGLAGVASTEEHEADRAAREDDPTPRPLVRAVLTTALADFSVGRTPLRVLDVCAGWGCWASEMRRLAVTHGWPVHITGVEIDHRKVDHLRKWCDAYVMVDWRAFLGSRIGVYAEFDLVIGNPHFSALTHEDPAQSMPAVLLQHAPDVLLFHQTASFARSTAGRDVWRAYPPAWVGLVPGSVGFRGRSKGADLRNYQATFWQRRHAGPAQLVMLPEPPSRTAKRGTQRSSSWHWETPPGTEDPSGDLPPTPGWRP